MTNKQGREPLTRDQISEYICEWCDAIQETIAALGPDLKRDNNDFIIDDSDLGIAVRELERVLYSLTRLSSNILRWGIEAAPPGVLKPK